MILHFRYAWIQNVTPFCLSGLFQGDIQQLLIVEDPQAAASYCVNYIPDCDSALPYNSHALQPLEVSIATKRKQYLLEKPMLIYAWSLDTRTKDWGIFTYFLI